MVHPAICNITGIIPHGNSIAELQSLLDSRDVISAGIPKIIPLQISSDGEFRKLWKTHMEKERHCLGIPGILRFSTPVTVSEDLKEVRRQIPKDRSIELFPNPEKTDVSAMMERQEGKCILLWGWERGEKKAPSVMQHDEGVSVTVTTFQLATVQMTLTETGLLTWRITDSCWASRS